MTIDVYSLLLLFAMASLAVAVVSLIPIPLQIRFLDRWRPRLAATLAMAAVLLALVIHLVFGHNPGTASGLSAYEFLIAHPAPLVIGGLSLLALIMSIFCDAA